MLSGNDIFEGRLNLLLRRLLAPCAVRFGTGSICVIGILVSMFLFLFFCQIIEGTPLGGAEFPPNSTGSDADLVLVGYAGCFVVVRAEENERIFWSWNVRLPATEPDFRNNGPVDTRGGEGGCRRRCA